MFKLIKSNFKITNDSIILTVPLILFLSIIGWYYSFSKESIDSIPKLVCSIITIFLMISGFLSAWLYMTKKTIDLSLKACLDSPYNSRFKDLLYLLKRLPQGFGRLFVPILTMTLVYTFIYSIFFMLIVVSIQFLGITISIDNLGLIKERLINNYSYLLILFFIIVCYCTLLWIPAIVYSKSNAFVSLKNSIYLLQTDFKNSVLLFVYILFLFSITVLINVVGIISPIIYFIVLTFSYYCTVYIVILLFRYYERLAKQN